MRHKLNNTMAVYGTMATGALTTRPLTTRPQQLVPYSYKKTTRPL